MSTVLAGRLRLDAVMRSPAAAAKIRVFVDGDPVRSFVTFDTWRGWVDVHQRDDRGHLLRRDGEVLIERRHGSVRAVASRLSNQDIPKLIDMGLMPA